MVNEDLELPATNFNPETACTQNKAKQSGKPGELEL